MSRTISLIRERLEGKGRALLRPPHYNRQRMEVCMEIEIPEAYSLLTKPYLEREGLGKQENHHCCEGLSLVKVTMGAYLAC